MTTCHGCNSPIEPLAAIRTYHSGCDPQMRVEMLERALKEIAGLYEATEVTPANLNKALFRASSLADMALAYRPAQMKGREG
jgi:hypothetical protein